GKGWPPMSPVLRFEPLDPRRFPPGSGPFRTRGISYESVLAYVDKALPGGRRAIAGLLGPGDPFAPYFDQIFVVSGDYDISPLARLLIALAAAAKREPGEFLEARSRKSAPQMAHGLWRQTLKASSPEAMAERLPLAHNRYFEPTRADARSVERGRFEAELSIVPAPMTGLYVASTTGFVAASLELAGGKDVRLAWSPPVPSGELAGVPTERVRFVA